MGPLMINMAFMPLYMWEMRGVTPVTHGRTVESSAVFSLSWIRNNNVLWVTCINERPPQPGNSFHMKANLSGNGVTAMVVRQLQKYIEQWIMMFVLQGVCVRGSLWLWIMGLPHGNCLLDKLTFLELVNWRLCHQCPTGWVFQHRVGYWKNTG